VPKQIRFVDSLPRTKSGQIDRKLLSMTKES
jgi:acyl-coenzyme A synthetase/AMP-(fatty) acid ligase